jgi:S1-C subfamily serine protease
MLARIGFVASILVWTFLRFQAQAADIPSLVQKAKPAVVQVIVSDGNWTPVRTGTGCFISADGDLLTNFHVIQGAVHISARPDKGAIFMFERVLAESADSDGSVNKSASSLFPGDGNRGGIRPPRCYAANIT